MTGDRPAWLKPVEYVDDRFESPAAAWRPPHDDDRDDERDARDIDEILGRPERREEKRYECTDTTPLDYSRGPHDEEFGVDEEESPTHSAASVKGPNRPGDVPFDEEEDFEPISPEEEEFPDDFDEEA